MPVHTMQRAARLCSENPRPLRYDRNGIYYGRITPSGKGICAAVHFAVVPGKCLAY